MIINDPLLIASICMIDARHADLRRAAATRITRKKRVEPRRWFASRQEAQQVALA